MPKLSTKKDKKPFQLIREELGLSRAEASELLITISDDRLEKIENDRVLPYPDEILRMAEVYKSPDLCNYYCSQVCPIGMEYVPQIKPKELSQIILETLASINELNRQKERLIEIAADGKITDSELDDFIKIQNGLEKISISVETLQLWSERMIATGVIDKDEYEKRKSNLK
jgi:hypothetical protein